MNILIACEESQAVCKAFRQKGHNAYSCDILEQSGGHPEWHINQDVLQILNPAFQIYGLCEYYGIKPFKTSDGAYHCIYGKWDMIVAFPPCTHLAVSGARHFEKKRLDGRQRDAIEFFTQFLIADCERICVENPVNIITGDGKYLKKYYPDLIEKYPVLPAPCSQIIQPWQFGHGETKATCLWLNGLDKLIPTDIVDGREQRIWKMPPSKDRAILRSKTYPGIAEAMANQWG